MGLAVAFWIYWLQRQTRELAFGQVSSRRPLAIADEMSSRVTVHLDGKPVGNLHLLVYALRNSGHKAITESDFVRPLSINFNSGEVVSAEIASQLPSNLSAKLKLTQDRVELAPLLLNPGDQLLIQVLLSSSKPSGTLDARIREVSEIVPINTEPRLPRFFDSGLPMAMYVAAGIGVLSFLFSEKRELSYVFMGLALFIPVFGFLSRLWQNLKPSARRRVRGL